MRAASLALGVAAAALGAACANDRGPTTGRRPEAGAASAQQQQQQQRITGTWELRFDLDRAPVFAADTTRAPRHLGGRIAFLPIRWPAPGAAYAPVETPAAYGVYDVDFTPFGFGAGDDGQPPIAVAGWLAADSLVVVLRASRDRAPVTLRGVMRGDSVSGVWDVSVGRAAGGGGRFVMRRAPRGP